MPEEYIVPLGIDASNLLKGMRDAETATDSLIKKVDEAGSKTTAAFSGGAAAAEKMEGSVNKIEPSLVKIRDTAANVKDQMAKVEKATADATKTEPVSRFMRIFNQLKDVIIGAKDNLDKTGTSTKALGKDIDETAKKTENFGSIAGKVAGALIAAFSLASIIALGKKIVEVTAEFQKFEAVLTNTLGSKSEAQKAMSQIVDFAKATPFAVDELTESFIKFANRGIILTRDEMTKLGDVASSQGKSFDQLTEAILDAQTGEFERLKEFGIRASKAGDQATISFGNVSKTVKNTEKDIRDAIIAIGDQEGVKGGMEAISKTIGGQISNIGDNVTSLFKTIGDGASEGIGKALGFVNDFISYLNEFFKSGKIQEYWQPVVKGFMAIAEAVEPIIAAVRKFFTESEAGKKIAEIFNEIPKIFGLILTVIGKAIGLTVDFFTQTQIGQDIISGLGKIFSFVGDIILGVFHTLEAIPFAFAAMKAGGQAAIDNIKANFKALGEQIDIIVLKAKKVFTFDDAAEAELEKKIQAAEKRKEALRASITDPAKVAKAAYDAAKAEVDADFKARQEAREREKNANKTDNSPVQGRATGASPTAQLSEAEIKKRAAAAKAQNDQLIALTQQLRQAELDAMEDGFAKERLVVQNNLAKQIEDLNKQKSLSKAASDERVALIEQLSNNAAAALIKINEKEVAQKQQLEFEAYKEITNLRKDSVAKELALIDIEFDEKSKKVKAQYKNQIALQTELLAALAAAAENKRKDTIYKDQLKQVEDSEKLTSALVKTYGSKRVKDIEGLSELEKNVAEKNKTTVLAIEKSKQLSLLAIQLLYAKQKLELAKTTYGADSDEAKKAAETIQAIEDSMTAEIDKKKGSVNIAALISFDASGSDIGGQIGKLLTFKTAGQNSIANQIGLTDEEAENIVAGVQSVMNSVQEIYLQAIQDQIDAKQRQVDNYTEQIDALQTQVDRETALQNAGYANNATNKKAELERLKKLREEEQKQKEELHKRQIKLQKEQIVINTILQLATLALAAVQIFQANAGIPFGIGVGIAIAAIAVMLSGYLAFKAKAKEATSDTDKFEKGGMIGGKRHSEGGQKYFANDDSGRVVELEDGEFVSNRKAVAKYSELLEAMNKDDFSGINDDALLEMLHGMGIHLEDESRLKALEDFDQNYKTRVALVMQPFGNQKSEASLEEIAENTRVLAIAEKTKTTTEIVGNIKVVKEGNVTRRIELNKPE